MGMNVKILLLWGFLNIVVETRRSEADVLRSRRRMLMDPRKFREGARSFDGIAVRVPPVLPEEVADVIGQERPEVETVKEVEEVEEVEERDLLDNLFFTFCCGDNLTCLKANMVCDGVVHCPDGEDESKCKTKQVDTKEEPREEENDIFSKDVVNSKEEDDIYAKDLVSIHTKLAKEAKARLKKEELVRKVVMVNGRRANVRRRKRLRKVAEEDKQKEGSGADDDIEKNKGISLTKAVRRKKVVVDISPNRELPMAEIKSKENDPNANAETELENNDTLASEIKLGKNELTMELPAASNIEPVDHERRDGGRMLFVRGRKVRVNKRRRQKASTNSSPQALQSLSHSESSLMSKDSKLDRPPPASLSSILFSEEQLRQFLGQEQSHSHSQSQSQSQRQTEIQEKDDNMHSARGDNLANKELPASLPDKGPANLGFERTWIFDSFQASSNNNLEKTKNPPLPGPALPPGFFESFDAQFV